VAASMGSDYFNLLSKKYHIPQAISGYGPDNLLEAVLALSKQINLKTAKTENLFPQAVSEQGNPKSHQLLEEVFEKADRFCNGYGEVKDAGFNIKNEYRMFDAEKVFLDVEIPQPKAAEGCLCGAIMHGGKTPADCPWFGKSCNPVNALGACMHSEEGPCRTAYLYG
jgi:hydrogenase expression/formation protein HypD